MDERIITSTMKNEDLDIENSLRPKTLDDYLGQEKVKEQLKIASGIKLNLSQEDIKIQGHAIECRINAKDAGTISELNMPSGLGVRVDSAIYCGYTIPPFYDSMIAKLIVWAPTRAEAIDKMENALSNFKIEGVNTTINLQKKILTTDAFKNALIDTNYLEEHLEEILNKY